MITFAKEWYKMLLFYHFGRYLLLMKRAFSRPDNHRILLQRIIQEFNIIGIESLGIVIMISIFMGMVMTIEIAYQLVSSFVPDSAIGEIITDTSMLELSPAITALVLAGRVGSNIASELGNMRISEQIDALDVMGVNSPNYLILPKVIASVLVFPMLIIISIALSIAGGAAIGDLTGICAIQDFTEGARHTFKPFTLIFSLIKAVTFAFVISSVSSYHGFYVKGGSLEVARASTRSVVQSAIIVLFFDYLLAQLLL